MTGWRNRLCGNSFVRLTAGCSGLLSLCLSLLPGLPCSAPALTVESVSPPNDVCSAQLIALCPHLQRERERAGEGGRERSSNLEQFVNYSCKNMRARSTESSHRATREVHWHCQSVGIHSIPLLVRLFYSQWRLGCVFRSKCKSALCERKNG